MGGSTFHTDGAAKGNPGAAGAGGFLRQSSGNWLIGFMAHLGLCSNVAAELHAIRIGLQLAWDEGYRKIVCEVDALVVLDILSSAEVIFHPLASLIMDIRELQTKKGMGLCLSTHTT